MQRISSKSATSRAPGLRLGAALLAVVLGVLGACRPADERALDAPAGVPAGPDAGPRIVSLAPNLTEILFALGLQDRVVGVTDYCDHPPEVREKTSIGGYVNPNLEAILALEPDLAVATPNIGNREAVLRLQELGVEFLIVDTPDLASLYAGIREIAARAGVPERGEALAGEMAAAAESIRARLAPLPRVRALFVFAHDPLIVAGPGTFFDEMLRLAGGENLASGDTGRFPHYSLERVVLEGPDVIVETVMAAGGEPDVAFWERWPTIPAVRDGRVCTPPPDPMLRPGPRVPEGLRLLAECLHPGALADTAPGAGGR